MIAVSVRYHNLLRRVTGLERETAALPAATARGLLEHLAETHGPPLRAVLFDPAGEISSHVVVFRNERLLPRERYDSPLADGDRVMLFPAISGG